MVSFAIVFRAGPAEFVNAAAEAGFSGVIVPDLPGDQAGNLYELARSSGLDLVSLVAPTTTVERVDRILQSTSGFVYCVSVAGTTGVREALPEELARHLAGLKKRTKLPLAVGFGIGRPEQIQSLRGLADGAIVGSALVRQIERLARLHRKTEGKSSKKSLDLRERMSETAHQPGGQ